MSDQEIKLFPVAATTVGPIPRLGLVTIRLDYLTGHLQDHTKPNQGLQYALTPVQATDLAQRILDALRQLETAEFQPAPGPQH